MHAARRVFLLLPILLITGCADRDGNRISVQEWWQQRNGAKKQSSGQETQDKDARVAEDGRSPAATNQDHHDSVNPQLASPAPSGGAPSGSSKSSVGPTIHADALIVNDETIRVGDILEPITSKLEELVHELPPDVYYAKAAQIVRLQIIEAVAQHLIWRRAQRQLTDELKPQLDKAVEKMEKERINREFGGRETMYEKYLARHGKTRTDARERLRRTLIIDSYLRDRLLQLIPTPRKPELEDYYKTHLSEFSHQERREMFLIDIPVRVFLEMHRPINPSDEAAAEQKARQAASEAVESIKRGEDFREVARKHSQGLHTDEGGAWGFITSAADRQSPPLEGRWSAPSKHLFELKPGETSEIVESARSFFIVKCGRIEGGHVVSFQDAQPQIVATIRQQRFLERRAAFLQEELDRSTIGSLDAFVSQVLHAAPSPDEKQLKFESADPVHR